MDSAVRQTGTSSVAGDPHLLITNDAAWVAANLAEADVTPLSSSDLRTLSRYLEPVQLEAGECIFHEGEHPGGVWILQSGSVEIQYGTGPHRALIRLLTCGEAIGDIQILRNVESPFKARAAEVSSCLFLERSCFSSLLLNNPTMARRWAAKLALQVSRNQDRILSLLTTALRERLARFLMDESVDGAFRHSQGTIASMLGVHRSSINQILGEFEQLGLIRVSYRCIELTDRPGLRRVSGGN